ncbi:MAG: hypothetical protein M3R24_31190 [Chloroflexota bacterium]|nr:hypothetical protein [Chloroflexota bacterium]
MPSEPETEPATRITSIELQTANGKIWGLLVVENPRDGQSVTLNLQYRAPGPRAQQTGRDGFIPTGETADIRFTGGQTHYNFSFERPPGILDNAEYRATIANQSGDVGGTDTTSPPVSFQRPAPTATATPRPSAPAASQPAALASPTATSAALGNVVVASPTSRANQQVPQAGEAAPAQSTQPRPGLPQSGWDDHVLSLLLVASGFLAADGWILQSQRRKPHK